MPAILPPINLDSESALAHHFMPHQLNWILADHAIHDRKEQVMALAEKSIRIGWTYADAFKNVRKRLLFPGRDYLFATKDYPSALEYVRQCRHFIEFFNYARAILCYGEDYLKVPRLNSRGRATGFTEEIKVSYIKFNNRSRILAFSAHPQAMAVYGGDVGLDEFARHANPELLWETAQGRAALGHDLAVWSAHSGQNSLFYQFAKQARACCTLPTSPTANNQPTPTPLSPVNGGEGRGEGAVPSSIPRSKLRTPNSTSSTPHSSCQPTSIQQATNPSIHSQTGPWNLYYRVTMPDALELGLLKIINQVGGTNHTAGQYLAQCRARSRREQIFQQSYLCNPSPSGLAIADWSTIERCRADYCIERLHLEHAQILELFGTIGPGLHFERRKDILKFLSARLPNFFDNYLQYRVGFDVAASGGGDLCAFYIDEASGPELWLRALITCRTDDWHFIQCVLEAILEAHKWIYVVGDESGLGRKICWETARQYPGRFSSVNFRSQKSDLGFTLMNQLSSVQKRFPREHEDIAADYFALQKSFVGNRWIFTEGHNSLNPASHCDIAWAGALATRAHTKSEPRAGAIVG